MPNLWNFVNSRTAIDKRSSGENFRGIKRDMLYFGFELEYEFYNSSVLSEYRQIMRNNLLAIYSDDCSLNSPSMEIRTNPCQFRLLPYFFDHFPLPQIRQPQRNGVGMHINISKNQFSSEEADSIHKLLMSIRPFADKIARRENSNWAVYRPENMRMPGGKGHAVNYNEERLEFRLFKTSTDKQEVLDGAGFVYALAKAAKEVEPGFLFNYDNSMTLLKRAYEPVIEIIGKYDR